MSRDENFQKLTLEIGVEISLILISYFLFPTQFIIEKLI